MLLNRQDETEAASKSVLDLHDSLYEKYLYDGELIKKLSEKGQQPSVELLAKNLMVC